jgi:hypothetical protein
MWPDGGGAAAFLIYLGLSMLFFGRAVGAGLSSFYVGDGPDPPQSILFLAWWAYALANRINQLFTHYGRPAVSSSPGRPTSRSRRG